MLRRERKIGARSRVSFVIAKGRRERFRLFSATIAQNRSSQDRFAVVVSTKISKKAVERNTVRRQIYESIRLKLDAQENKPSTLQNKSKPCYDVVVFAAPQIRTARFTEISTEVNNLLRKLDTL